MRHVNFAKLLKQDFYICLFVIDFRMQLPSFTPYFAYDYIFTVKILVVKFT